MAEVYLAQARGEAGFEKLVALKVLHKHMAANAQVVEHFLDEARVVSRLDHPNIIQITDLGKAEDAYFIAMEFIDGVDLDRVLTTLRAREIAMPQPVAVAILRKICDGLHAAHSAVGADGNPLNLVHRDVKSGNIFVARNGVVKVGDFGIAKSTYSGRAQMTEAGQVKGTPAYMAPEQRMGKMIDRRADVYAVGTIAYEMLSGTEINLDLAALAHMGTAGWPHLPSLSQVRSDLAPELDAIVVKALKFQPEERFASCEELEHALETVANRIGPASEKVIAQFIETYFPAKSSKQ
jgi:serine/threonine-protein kinase